MLSEAVHEYIARSPALLLSVQLDDLTGATEQANVPGTPDQPPNWRRKAKTTLEEMRADERYERIAKNLCEARTGGARPAG
jgi:4-alpha-glucanotransferase